MYHALLNSGLETQTVSLTVTLPLSEYYDGDCQRNKENIRLKREKLMHELVLNKSRAFTVTDVKVIPVFFDGHLSAIRLCALMALVSGTWSSLSGLPDEPDGGVAALAMSPETEYQRRRYTLTLLDDRSS